MKIRAIILDFDGVIVETVGIKEAAFSQIFSRYPKLYRKAIDFHRKYSGLSRVVKFEYLLNGMDADERKGLSIEGLCQEFSAMVIESVIKAPYVDGAIEFLEHFKKSTPLFLASITPQNELEQILKRRGIAGYFDGVIGGTGKKAQMIRDITAQGGFDPRDVVFIGDTIQDYEAALETFAYFIGRRNQHAFPECVYSYPTLGEIKKHIISMKD